VHCVKGDGRYDSANQSLSVAVDAKAGQAGYNASSNNYFAEEEPTMATFITTIHFTEQGIKTVRESSERAAAFKATAKKMGVKVTGTYWTLGAFDGVIICEAQGEEAVTAALLHLGSQGNLRTQTSRAYDAAEMQKILGLLPK